MATPCSEYQITQNMRYRWRDMFLANAAQLSKPEGQIVMKNALRQRTQNEKRLMA